MCDCGWCLFVFVFFEVAVRQILMVDRLDRPETVFSEACAHIRIS